MGGGGRGMRVVHAADELDDALEQARREAGTAFGIADVFLEKFIQRAKHIEVQLLGDQHGNLVHLFERDCSVQRRHQKVVEIAPAPNLRHDVRQGILRRGARGRPRRAASTTPARSSSSSTPNEQFYFIEVNPRIQVEHTVTEAGHRLSTSSIADPGRAGLPLDDPEIGLATKSRSRTRGFAIQCRVTTEDPANNFMPDYGRLSAYRSPAAWASASTPARRSPARSSRRSTIRCW